MVDLIKSGLAFVILILSLITFFGIAIFLYVGWVKGYPTVAGMKIRLKDFWYYITFRKSARIAQRKEELEQIKIEQTQQHEPDVEIGRLPQAHIRPDFNASSGITGEAQEVDYGGFF